MPHDEAQADELASSHLDGTQHRATVRAASLCRVRRSIAFGQAVANGGRAGEAARAQGIARAEQYNSTV
jgi:hypothetical protein